MGAGGVGGGVGAGGEFGVKALSRKFLPVYSHGPHKFTVNSVTYMNVMYRSGKERKRSGRPDEINAGEVWREKSQCNGIMTFKKRPVAESRKRRPPAPPGLLQARRV